MANIPLTVGKVRTNLFAVRNADGTTNATLSLSASAGNETNLRVRINPNNPREVGAMGLVAGTSANATVSVLLPGGTKQVQDLMQMQAPAAVNQEALVSGGWSDEIDPPAWML